MQGTALMRYEKAKMLMMEVNEEISKLQESHAGKAMDSGTAAA